MRFTIRSILVVLFIAIVTCVGLARTQAARDAVLSMQSYLEPEPPVEIGGKSNADMEIEARQTKRRLQIKRSVIHDLIEARINLEQATEIFVELNNSPPRCSAARVIFPSCSEKEATALQVMLHARAYVEEHSALYSGDVLTRLESELEQLQSELSSVQLVEHLVQ